MGALLLPYLDDTELVFPVGEPEFEALAVATLGTYGTADDGFDAEYNQAMSDFATEDLTFHELDSHLALMDYVTGAFGSSTYDPITKDTAAYQSAGDKLFDDLNKALVIPGAQPPPPPPPPGGGGGGGGGGGRGGGGGGTGPCGDDPFGDVPLCPIQP